LFRARPSAPVVVERSERGCDTHWGCIIMDTVGLHLRFLLLAAASWKAWACSASSSSWASLTTRCPFRFRPRGDLPLTAAGTRVRARPKFSIPNSQSPKQTVLACLNPGLVQRVECRIRPLGSWVVIGYKLC
jgi:hypothetical protein